MSPLFFGLAFALVALLVYMGRYSGRVRAEESRLIAAAPEAVYERVADLAGWQAWNPWLEHARDVPAEVDGLSLAWDVPRVGRGRMRQVGQTPPRALRQRLQFDLPFSYRGRSDWRFEPAAGGGTRVTWRFKGRVAFTLRAFASTVQGATALDLRFGLDRLAALLEGGPPAYTLDYAGVREQPTLRLVQVAHKDSLDKLAAALPPRISDLRRQLTTAGLPASGPAIVHYLKTHLKLRTVDCRIGFEVPAGANAPDGFTLQEQPFHSAYMLRFDGPPEALELAWYQAMQRLRVEQQQPHPQLPPSAVYLGESAPGRRGVVELHLPLKA
ncbi:SRPBCC family protein [Roseateles sp.]|uniref:SRPBCC family protein n=1 Tax=Roseateles sp. TaxID=1971397 RepID=UPI0039EC0F2A